MLLGMAKINLTEGSVRTRETVLLLRLIESGQSPFSEAAQPIAQRLLIARWIRPATRGQGWELADDQRHAVLERLCLLWPAWEQESAMLRELGLNPWLVTSIQALPALRRRQQATGYIHRKTWNAASSAGSKRRSQVLSSAVLTDDWVVRGRTNANVYLVTPESRIDWKRETELNMEFTVSERSWLRSSGLSGEAPSLVVTVENIGAFVDMPMPTCGMIVFAPGTATAGAAKIVSALASSAWVHFGDLDPAGVAACCRIASDSGRTPQLFIPSFADEYLDGALPVKRRWPMLPLDHPTLTTLAAEGTWLEQEAFLLDPRLPSELEALAHPYC